MDSNPISDKYTWAAMWGSKASFKVICVSLKTHLPLVPHICTSGSGQHWFRKWLVAWSAPSHYLNQCWNVVNWTLGDKLRWNLNRNSHIFIQENAFEHVVWKMAAILSRSQCVKDVSIYRLLAPEKNRVLCAPLIVIQIWRTSSCVVHQPPIGSLYCGYGCHLNQSVILKYQMHRNASLFLHSFVGLSSHNITIAGTTVP